MIRGASCPLVLISPQCGKDAQGLVSTRERKTSAHQKEEIMKSISIITLAIVLSLVSAGCATTVGRFVTNVSGGATEGSVNVERCELRRNVWTGEFDTSNCETTTVGLR